MKYDIVKPQELKCEYDKTLGVMIHRFKMGVQICQCGAISNQKERVCGGWRQLHEDTPKVKS